MFAMISIVLVTYNLILVVTIEDLFQYKMILNVLFLLASLFDCSYSKNKIFQESSSIILSAISQQQPEKIHVSTHLNIWNKFLFFKINRKASVISFLIN